MVLVFVCGGLVASAQFGREGTGGPPKGANMNGALAKLFGDLPGFTANMEMQTALGGDEKMIYPGKIAMLDNKSRFEMDSTQVKGLGNPNATAQMRSMGLDKMVSITRPDKKVTYMIFPGLNAYSETPLTDPQAIKPRDKFTVETTQVAREKVDDHDCVKNHVVVIDDEGNRSEATVWNANDLDKFPVKIERMEGGRLNTVLFKNIELKKPDAKLFEPPAEMTKYTSHMDLMQKEMVKKYKNGERPVIPREPQSQ